MLINKNKSYLIAEIGVNHNGSLKRALKLIDIAKKSGFDAVKFQSFKAEKLCVPSTPLVDYQKRSKFNDQYQMLRKLAFKKKYMREVYAYCKKRKIEFISTPFDIENAFFLDKLGVKTFKISSSDLDNFYLLKTVRSFNKKVIISTGMSTYDEIKKTISFLNLSKNKLFILHCVSDYPTNLKDTNLGFFEKLKKLNFHVGFSDHTIGSSASIAAVVMGSKIIEKHITLNKFDKGPDHFCSLESKDCSTFVKNIRDLEKSLASKNKIITLTEKKTRLFARKSIYTTKKIKKGEKFSISNTEVLRPKLNGISPTKYYKIINRKAKKEFKAFEIIKKIT